MPLTPRTPNYDLNPFVEVPGSSGACVVGWEAIAALVRDTGARVVAVDCYSGVDERAIRQAVSGYELYDTRVALKSTADIEKLVEPYLGGDDPIFGFLCPLTLPEFFDDRLLKLLKTKVATTGGIVIGPGAALCCEPDLVVYADMPRWEGQLRQRRGEAGNLFCENAGALPGLLYKRSYFVDWRVLDRHKQRLSPDFYLDTTDVGLPKLAAGEVVRSGLRLASQRPFRVVPFFDPGPWGGQWMREVCGLDSEAPNYAWCFDCVPEENSLKLKLGDELFELPALNLVFQEPEALLGQDVFRRFGAEFPIRFDFLDTMGGGNLSLQVHPTTDYIRKAFGMPYTQDESYYLLDAEPGAFVYLGLKEGIDQNEMLGELAADKPFDAERFVAKWPAKKHDHFLIPAGTVHCSGANAMVLEISATPYIFTFKLWDWDRLGLDGRPRPINIGHGKNVIDWSRTESWVADNLVGRVEEVAKGEGWREERTGLHELEFIDTRRFWFDTQIELNTHGTVNVLNLVEGEEAVVESPTNAFEPFVVHYAETFIVPAYVGPYTVRPTTDGAECAIIKAHVREGR